MNITEEALVKYYTLVTKIYHAHDDSLTFPLNHEWPQNKFVSGSFRWKLMNVFYREGISVDEVVTGFNEIWPKSEGQVCKDENGGLLVKGAYSVSHLLIALTRVVARKAEKDASS